jgi:hypothetical protein
VPSGKPALPDQGRVVRPTATEGLGANQNQPLPAVTSDRFMQDARCGLPRTPTFPDVGRLWVMVPIRTESWMRFSATLHDGASEVRFEQVTRQTHLHRSEAN